MALTPQSLVNKSLELVSPPSTYARLDELIHDPDSAIDDIERQAPPCFKMVAHHA